MIFTAERTCAGQGVGAPFNINTLYVAGVVKLERRSSQPAMGIISVEKVKGGGSTTVPLILCVFRSPTSSTAFSVSSSEDSYTVIDYALRDQIRVGLCQPEDLNLSPIRSTASMLGSRQAGASNLFRLCFRSNHSGETVTMILGTELL